MRSVRILALVAMLALVAPSPAAAAPEGTLTWAVHITLAPTFFDPAETPGIITPFMVIYALHDALVKPMPGKGMAPSLAESWTVSKDGRTYEFVLRKGVRFHNGDTLTSEDVKFSFERYKGAGAGTLKAKVERVETPEPHRVRFVLKQPWPDFLTFYGTPATGAAWIVPKKYVEQVGAEGFKKAPVGAGPYKFVSFKPGVELTLEAHPQYWRKAPQVKTLVLRTVPDESTRLAALKRGEVDIAYSITGPLAEELKRTPGLTLKPTYLVFTSWLNPVEQWDPKSPWHHQKVRLAANLAIDREAINQANYLGLARLTSSIIPHKMEYFWQPPPYTYDPAQARKLLAEAGYPNGFDAGELSGDTIYGTAIGEPAVNYFNAVGIRVRLRIMERAAYYTQYGEKKLRGVLYTGSAAFGNAATRLEAYVVAGGRYVYGSHPDIDGLFTEQINETNDRVRNQILTKIQQMVHERAIFIPVMEPAFLNGVGPRVAHDGLNDIPGFAYSAPYEDLKLKGK
ncbi:MAG TPA: ABC transporter substrate-binding protein [Candidatus Tectomicrobia bacterium]|nr:ABC transporter substrate-binding protein [Candidatus Tectomicrobia bacterium]